MKITKSVLNSVPLDFYDSYSTPISLWIKNSNSFKDTKSYYETDLDMATKIEMYQMAVDEIKKQIPLFSLSDLRGEPHVHITVPSFVLELSDEGDYNGFDYWFIFKEDNNGTTHKIRISF